MELPLFSTSKGNSVKNIRPRSYIVCTQCTRRPYLSVSVGVVDISQQSQKEALRRLLLYVLATRGYVKL